MKLEHEKKKRGKEVQNGKEAKTVNIVI